MPSTTKTFSKPLSLAAALCAGALSLAACANDGDGGSSDAAPEATKAELQASVVQFVDSYCRAKPAVDDAEAHEQMTDKDMKHADMTACFGTLKNLSDKDISVESFASPTLDGATTELHETVDGMMRPKDGGFTIDAGGTYELVPGGDHLMIMNYPGAIPAGEKLAIEITMGDDSTLNAEIPVREQPSGEENYAGH